MCRHMVILVRDARRHCEAWHFPHDWTNHVLKLLKHMAVKKPVSGSLRRPAHVERLSLSDALRYNCRTRICRVIFHSSAAIEGVNLVLEAM